MQLDLQDASRVPLLRTQPEGFCSSSYKHATPNGVKTVNAFFHGFGNWWDFEVSYPVSLAPVVKPIQSSRNFRSPPAEAIPVMRVASESPMPGPTER